MERCWSQVWAPHRAWRLDIQVPAFSIQRLSIRRKEWDIVHSCRQLPFNPVCLARLASGGNDLPYTQISQTHKSWPKTWVCSLKMDDGSSLFTFKMKLKTWFLTFNISPKPSKYCSCQFCMSEVQFILSKLSNHVLGSTLPVSFLESALYKYTPIC